MSFPVYCIISAGTNSVYAADLTLCKRKSQATSDNDYDILLPTLRGKGNQRCMNSTERIVHVQLLQCMKSCVEQVAQNVHACIWTSMK